MVKVETLFKNYKFPAVVSGHAIWKSLETIEKIFPSIGLNDCSKDTIVDNKASVLLTSETLLTEILASITRRIEKIAVFAQKQEGKMKEGRCKRYDNIVHLLTEAKNVIEKNRKQFTTIQKNRITLNMPAQILNLENKVEFAKGERLFSVYNKLSEYLSEGKFAKLRELEKMNSFKEFSSANFCEQKFSVKFSSSTEEGLWDLATISGRGIESCQGWTGAYARCLVGTLVDPLTGVIFLTDNKKFNEKGSKMIRRCMVRLACDQDKNPYILVDRMYPNFDASSMETFKTFLEEKTHKKIPVQYLPNIKPSLMNQVFLPITPKVRELPRADRTYRDTQLPYKVGYIKFRKKVAELFEDMELQSITNIENNKQESEEKPKSKIKEIKNIIDINDDK